MIHKITLIVCTRNRADSLRACLSSIQKLKTPYEWELIVVNNGSTDSTDEVLSHFGQEASFPVQIVMEPEAGLSRARNRGIAAASGDVILFTDDDCYPEPDYLIAAADVLEKHSIGYFGGRVLLHDPADARVTIQESESVAFIAPHSFVRAGTIHGANVGFRREVVRSIGGFNEALGAGTTIPAGEDVEFLGRASAAGFTGGYFPAPTVRHHHGRKKPHIKSLNRGYNIGRGAYYMSMILLPDSRKLYLRTWWRSLSWRHPRSGWYELLGAGKYWATHRKALRTGGILKPRIGLSVESG